MNYKELKKFVGARIRYIKPNTRYEWEGTLNYVTNKHVRVLYDHGLEQTYVFSAFIQPRQAKDCVCSNCGFMNYGYLEILA